MCVNIMVNLYTPLICYNDIERVILSKGMLNKKGRDDSGDDDTMNGESIKSNLRNDVLF